MPSGICATCLACRWPACTAWLAQVQPHTLCCHALLLQIASLPHLEVRFLDASGTHRSVLLMLDTGACGADIMLHSRAIQELGLDLGFGEAGR